jgi:hypothetical protein
MSEAAIALIENFYDLPQFTTERVPHRMPGEVNRHRSTKRSLKQTILVFCFTVKFGLAYRGTAVPAVFHGGDHRATMVGTLKSS